jgi:hypothetical protein
MMSASVRPRALAPSTSILRLGGRFSLLFLFTTSCSAASCQSAQFSSRGTATASLHLRAPDLDDYVTWQRHLEFRDSAASGAINVHLDRMAGFVVADAGQTQVRVYSDESNEPELLWARGRKGDGPGDFQVLRSAVRTSSADVVALENSGRLTIFDASGNLKRTVPTGLNPAFNIWLINDSTLLISGRRTGGSDSLLLHVWDLRRDRFITSFFEVPPHPARFDEAYRYSGWANAALLGGDTVAITFPLADTLYLYRTDGSAVDKFKLPLEHYRRLRDPGPRDQTPEARVEWRNSYTRLSQVFRAPDGSIYIQYYNLSGLDPVWGIARFFMDRDRLHKSFEVPNSYRLLGISPRDSSLYFLRTDLIESTTWSLGRLSR